MEEITSFISTLTSKPEWIAYICLLLTLIGISIYVYYYFVEPKLYPDYVSNNEFTDVDTTTDNKVGNNDAFLYLYSVDWCPHCCKLGEQDFFDTWFKEGGDMYNRQWGEYNLHIRNFNPEKDSYDDDKHYSNSSTGIQKMISEYKPDGYPSVVLFNADGKTVELDAKINDESLRAFLKVKLGKLQE